MHLELKWVGRFKMVLKSHVINIGKHFKTKKSVYNKIYFSPHKREVTHKAVQLSKKHGIKRKIPKSLIWKKKTTKGPMYFMLGENVR